MLRITLVLAFCTVLLSACTRVPPVPPQMPFAEPGVSLIVTQKSDSCGPTGAYRAEVAWQVPATMATRLEVQVGAMERKYFVRSKAPSGKQETGEWVSPGLAFFLVDRDANKVIAATTAGPGMCKRSNPAG